MYPSEKLRISARFIILPMLVFPFILAGCSISPSLTIPESRLVEPYIPATLSPTQSDASNNNEPLINDEINQLDCIDNLTFLTDVTIPDGTVVTAGEIIDKQWEIKNSGTCNWNQSYYIRLVAGDDMGAARTQALYPARGGTKAIIRILFTAPEEAGIYRSQWQAFNPNDQYFGDPFYTEIVVES